MKSMMKQITKAKLVGKPKEVIQKLQQQVDLANKKPSHGKLGGNLEDVHMKDSTKPEERIYERNPDNEQVRSRKSGDHGNETIEGNIDQVMDKVIHPVRKRIREEVLDELWAAPKLNHEGHWYIRLSDTIKIIQGEI